MSSQRLRVARRRTVGVTAVAAGAVALTVSIVPLVAVLVVADLLRLRTRLPLARLALFGWCWAWLETLGATAAAALWVAGRRRDLDAHYEVQRWWAGRLIAALRTTCGIELDVEGVDALLPTPTVLLVRHASLADSLLTAWVVADLAHLRPRVVLKDELLADPCLDIVGNRLPNCFVDRGAADSTPALESIERLGATMDDRSVSIIFPEGTRANDAKRSRALERIRAHDPGRADRLGALVHLLPPRPAGTRALLRGSERVDAGVVVGWHTGFDGLDTFGGIVAALSRPDRLVHFRLARIQAPPTLEPAGFERWIDDLWITLDREVDSLGPVRVRRRAHRR